MAQNLFLAGRRPVQASEVRIESIGVNPLDRRRVDVAVDLTPCLDPVTVEMAIVGPDDEEWCSSTMVESREWMLDKILYLRRDGQPGEYTLHVGVFYEGSLVHATARRFMIPPAG